MTFPKTGDEFLARDVAAFVIRKIVESERECHVQGVTEGWTTDVRSLVEDVFAVGDAVLETRYVDTQDYAGWVLLIPENGEDVISDYSLSIEEVVDPVIAQLEVC